MLYCIQQGISPNNLNIHLELRNLTNKGWITGSKYELTPQAISFIEQIQSYFQVHKKKTTSVIMGDNYNEYIQKYLLLFPKIKLPSGKAARTDATNCETAFKWFFDTYSYSWEVILNATGMYIDEYEKKNYMYMQTSQYFIRKQLPDKTWGSELANWCSNIQNNEVIPQDIHFTEKVV